ncbi:hypothetical protein ACFYVR_25015 [Rhodococcus sp. NPDC003318]|uniref:hypothetical protein n=1 Tax=Rhodococcus sp. NPDC003318 TaxID=3364503 RepID=UPI0036A14092
MIAPDDYRPGRFTWRELDQDQAAQLWAELADWVEWFRDRYELAALILPCWFRHGPIVEELTAAMAAHRVAYEHTKVSYSFSPATWHYQVYAPLLGRLKSYKDSSCTNTECGHRPLPITTAPDLAEFIAEDVAGRPEQTATSSPSLLGELNRSLGNAVLENGSPVGGVPESVDPARMMDLVDAGEADAEDPGDEFGPVTWSGRRWEYSDATDMFIPVS